MGFSFLHIRSAHFTHLNAFSLLWLTGIVLISLFFAVSCTPQPEPNLFDSHFLPYKDIISKRGAMDGVSPLLIEAMEYYNNGDYAEALTRFKQVNKDEPDNPAVRFYLGISYLGLKKPNHAVAHFNEVLKHQDITFGPHAEWYLALSHLKAHNQEKAISLLEEINRNNPRYRSHSASILTLLPGGQAIMGETASTHQDPL